MSKGITSSTIAKLKQQNKKGWHGNPNTVVRSKRRERSGGNLKKFNMHTETMVNLLCPCPQNLLKIEQDVVDLVGLPHTSAVTMVTDLKTKKKVDAASAGRDKCSNHGDCPKSKKKKKKKML